MENNGCEYQHPWTDNINFFNKPYVFLINGDFSHNQKKKMNFLNIK
jgi:hypothetical protein